MHCGGVDDRNKTVKFCEDDKEIATTCPENYVCYTTYFELSKPGTVCLTQYFCVHVLLDTVGKLV